MEIHRNNRHFGHFNELKRRFSHSLSKISPYGLFLLETSPAGKIPTQPPFWRCFNVSRIPEELLYAPFLFSKGFTEITYGSMGFIFPAGNFP